MYPEVEAMWLGKRFIASIKADNGLNKNKSYIIQIFYLISGRGVKGSVSLNYSCISLFQHIYR